MWVEDLACLGVGVGFYVIAAGALCVSEHTPHPVGVSTQVELIRAAGSSGPAQKEALGWLNLHSEMSGYGASHADIRAERDKVDALRVRSEALATVAKAMKSAPSKGAP